MGWWHLEVDGGAHGERERERGKCRVTGGEERRGPGGCGLIERKEKGRE